LVTGIERRWIRVSARPIARGANAAGDRSSVAPRMTIRKAAVSTVSTTSAMTNGYPLGDASPYPFVANPPRSKPGMLRAIMRRSSEATIAPTSWAAT
jgi:hypothetical protein